MQKPRSSSSTLAALSCAATLVGTGLGIGPAQSQAPAAPAPVPVPQVFEYAVKFVCGRSVALKQTPLQVAPGYYWTDINVHNPNAVTSFRKKFVLALIDQKQSKPTDFSGTEFGPDYAFAVECAEIMKRLGVGGFATGFVVFQSPRELDIVAVYTTAATPTGPVSTLHMERVPKRP